jgi:hypothetical protein
MQKLGRAWDVRATDQSPNFLIFTIGFIIKRLASSFMNEILLNSEF